MTIKKTLLLAAAGLGIAFAGASSASAATPWQLHHARRAEVNARLDNQYVRVREEQRRGEISPMKAHRLHMADRRIRGQERHFAAFHGGHISRAEQARLNREEGRVSHRIG